jgi:1,4-alpha-glucan branching enzyme
VSDPARLLFVLHGHIPDVVGHGTWPHGENWLYEAAAETYLPFLRHMWRLRADGVRVRVTVGMTPVLAEQLEDERFKDGFVRYTAQRARAAALDRDALGQIRDRSASDLAEGWRRFYTELRELFLALPDRDIVAAFRELAEEGLVEPIASAATHGFLPLLPNDTAIERQLDVGLAAHARHFGRPARGIWLPECAYRPAGEWLSPADGHVEVRRGLEDFLAERGVEFFFVETHLVKGGIVTPAYGGEVESRMSGSPYRINAVFSSSGKPVAVYARDPLSSQQVWSGIVGYPGDGRYLEFHKKRAPSGHRYWRVTDSKLELHKKEPYDPAAIPAAIESHAAHFVSMVENVSREGMEPPVVVGMFDFELFGHWWFEGPDFLAAVLRRLAKSEGAVAVTASEALAQTPPTRALTMPAGTWGRNGDFQVWWNDHTVDYWQRVTEVERTMERFEAERERIPPNLFAAMERQTLLLQSSDWPFLIDNEVSQDYARHRIAEHHGDFRRLAAMAEKGILVKSVLDDIEYKDRLFAQELGD